MTTALLLAAAFASGALLAGYSVRFVERHRAGTALSELRARTETDRARSYLAGVQAGRAEWADIERARSTHPTTHPLGQVARLFGQERD